MDSSVSRIGHGALVWIRTVKGSTTSTWLSGRERGGAAELELGIHQPLHLNFTASPSNGSPLWNFTPGRSLNSHTVGDTSFGSSAQRRLDHEVLVALEQVSNMFTARFAAGDS